MKRIPSLLLFLTILAPLRPAAHAEEPQALSSFAALLPAETLAFLEVDDLGGVAKRLKESALGRIWLEPEVQHFIATLEASLGAAQQGFNPLAIIGLQPADFDGIELRHMGIALCAVNPEEPPYADALLSLEFRQGGAKSEKIFRALLQALQTFLGVPVEETTLGGKAGLVIRPMGLEICFVSDGNRILVTTNRARMEKTLGGGPGAKLSQTPRYTKIVERMGAKRAALFGYLDAASLYTMLMGAIDEPEARTGGAHLGLDAMEAIALADIPDGAEMRTEFAVTLRERRGLFALAQLGKVGYPFAGMVPANAMLYSAERVDLGRFMDDALALLEGLDRESRTELDALVARYNEALGLDLRKDLLDSFGTEWATSVGAPPGGGLIPDLVVYASVKNRPALERALTALAGGVEAAAAIHGERARRDLPRTTPRTMSFGDQTIHYVEITQRNGEPLPIVPCWSFVGEQILMGIYPQTLKHILASHPTFAESGAMRGVLARIPASATSFTWIDTTTLFVWLYQTAVPLLQGSQGAINAMLGRLGASISLVDLPRAEVIARHLEPTVFYTAPEEDCLRMGYVSPYGSAIILVPVVAGGTAALFLARGAMAEPQEWPEPDEEWEEER